MDIIDHTMTALKRCTYIEYRNSGVLSLRMILKYKPLHFMRLPIRKNKLMDRAPLTPGS